MEAGWFVGCDLVALLIQSRSYCTFKIIVYCEKNVQILDRVVLKMMKRT